MGPEVVIYSCPEQEFSQQAYPPLLPQDDHFVIYPDFFNLFGINAGLCYCFYLLHIYFFGRLFSKNESLEVNVLVKWGEGEMLCILEVTLGDRSMF